MIVLHAAVFADIVVVALVTVIVVSCVIPLLQLAETRKKEKAIK